MEKKAIFGLAILLWESDNITTCIYVGILLFKVTHALIVDGCLCVLTIYCRF